MCVCVCASSLFLVAVTIITTRVYQSSGSLFTLSLSLSLFCITTEIHCHQGKNSVCWISSLHPPGQLGGNYTGGKLKFMSAHAKCWKRKREGEKERKDSHNSVWYFLPYFSFGLRPPTAREVVFQKCSKSRYTHFLLAEVIQQCQCCSKCRKWELSSERQLSSSSASVCVCVW